MLGAGDAVIGINTVTDSVDTVATLLAMLEEMRVRLAAPIQSCVLAHVTTTIAAIERSVPVDLVFQSIAGTQSANRAFGISLAILSEAREAAARSIGASRNERHVFRDRARQRAVRKPRRRRDQRALERAAMAARR
jgi:ethanolamine ammonia-lyase large subunit